MNRSPIILQFDSDEAYEPENEDVFDEDEEDVLGKSIDVKLKVKLLK
jgi:hypothetical protein